MGNNKYDKKLVSASDVVELYTQIEDMGIRIWVDGGWCTDALLGRQLRPHGDLDIAVQWKDVPKLRETLATRGFRQIKEDSQWNFVLSDKKGREVDIHAFRYDDKGNVVEGIMYPAKSLTGTGTIEGRAVRCVAPRYMVGFLAPWIHKWPEKYLEAVSALCEKFHIDLPGEYTEEIQVPAK